MLGTALLDTVIGLSFVFFLVAISCTALVEFIATIFKKRAKYLLRGMRDLLEVNPTEGQHAERAAGVMAAARSPMKIYNSVGEERSLYRAALAAGQPERTDSTETRGSGPRAEPADWAMAIMGHPLVRVFKQTRADGEVTRNPAYLPASTFARALIDLVVPDGDGRPTVDLVRSEIDKRATTQMPFKDALIALLKNADDDIWRFRASLEAWYDGKMAQISGAYKRWAKRWIIVFGLAVAAVFGVDAVAIATTLYNDGPLRAAVVEGVTGGTLCEQGEDVEETKSCVEDTFETLSVQGFPIGWKDPPDDLPGWSLKVLGLALTAGAATFGAPFWFDALSRLGSLRNTGDKPRSADQ